MVIDLTELEEGEASWKKQAEPEEFDLAFPDYLFSEPVDIQLHISHIDTQYIIRGLTTTKVGTKCVKCLTPFELPVRQEINWAIQIADDPKMIAQEEESEDFWLVEKGCTQLDIGNRIREMVLVSLPTHPVCRQDCRGLCAQCGANLNDSPCGCSAKEIDNRWGPLKRLLDKQQNSPDA